MWRSSWRSNAISRVCFLTSCAEMNRWKLRFKWGLNVGEVDTMCRWTVRGCIVQLCIPHTHLFLLLWVCLKSVLACRFEITVVSSIFEFPIFLLVNKSIDSPELLSSKISRPTHLLGLFASWLNPSLFPTALSVRYLVFSLCFNICQSWTGQHLFFSSWVIDRRVLLITNIPTNRNHVT